MTVLAARLRADDRGAAIIELALVAPMFAAMTIGVIDLSNAYSRKLALEQGAQRAIEKVMQTTEVDTVENTLKTEAVCQVNGTNADGTCKTAPISAANVTVNYRVECVSNGTVSSTQTTTDSTAFDAITCGALREQKYIEVKVTDSYAPMFPLHFSGYKAASGGLAAGYQMQAIAGVRTE
ncbi:MAG: TadE family protein [Sphingomicrobium sp.]